MRFDYLQKLTEFCENNPDNTEIINNPTYSDQMKYLKDKKNDLKDEFNFHPETNQLFEANYDLQSIFINLT